MSRDEFPPRFEALNKTARDLSPPGATGIHLDNSTIQLYSEDSNPMGAKKKIRPRAICVGHVRRRGGYGAKEIRIERI